MQFTDPLVSLVITRIRADWAKLRARMDDRGGLSIEMMIIIGTLVAGAAILTTTLLLKVNEKKDQIK